MSADRPAHLISPDEVDAWLAGSAVQTVTYHRTTYVGAGSIIAHGVDVTRSRIGAYGHGFYSASAPVDEELYETTLTVAIRLERSLSGSYDEIAARVDDLVIEMYGVLRPITPAVAAAIRRRFISLGYDGLVVRDAADEGVDYVVAFFGASVKVVQA